MGNSVTTLDITIKERLDIKVAVEGLIEGWLLLEETLAVMEKVVRNHGYEPKLITQERVGESSWVIKTDKDIIRIAPWE